MLAINGLKFPVRLVVQRLIKLAFAKQLNVLVNIFHRKTPRANISYIFTYLYSMCQKMYLTRAELNQLFTSNINEEQQSARLTLETTSFPKNNITVYPQKHVKQTSSLPQKPVLPEPQNDSHWLMKKSGNISKCRGCKE